MTYRLTKQTCTYMHFGAYATHGIELVENGKIVDKINDVCVNFSQAEKIVALLNEYEVSEVHFFDVVYDLINQLE